MEFRNTSEVNKFISKLILLDETGSQGVTYVDKEFKRVYKFFYSFLDPGFLEGICNDPSKEELLQFRKIKTETFIFPEDVITIQGLVIGYITPYVPAQNLYKVSPYHINIDWLIKVVRDALKDIERLSATKIVTHDMMYNI